MDGAKAALDPASVGNHPTRSILERKQRRQTGGNNNCNHCITHIYVSAHTSLEDGSETDNVHNIEFKALDNTHTSRLRDMPKNQASLGKGDLWKLSLDTDFHVNSSCIRKTDIEYIAIKENGTDGQKIDSIITILKYNGGGYEVASLDMDKDQWIDRDGDHTQPGVLRYYRLTLTFNVDTNQ